MSAIDTLIVATLAFAGIYLLVLTGVRMDATAAGRKARAVYSDRHLAWTRTLIDKGCLAPPGVELVQPLGCWIGAEAVFLAVVSIGAHLAGSIPHGFIALGLALVGGTVVLLMSFRDRSRKELGAFQKDLPLAAFLMSLLIESGMGSASAMRETVEALPQRTCSRELAEIMRGRELGRSRSELFDSSRKRVPLDDYRAFLNLVEQGERLGVGLSRGLSDLSDRMLETESHRAEMLAQQAGVKMLLPLVLFIFPAVFLIVLSPVILNICSFAGWK